MIKNIAVKLQYDGSRYSGWQKQGNTDNTIQSKLESILKKLSNTEIEVHGSGRTDSGVHAFAQIANFKIETSMSTEEIIDYLNSYLPNDIAVISAWEAPPRFHSRLNAVRKTYRYRILTGNIPNVFEEKYLFNHKSPLNLDKMQEASKYFVGTHDFKSFTDNKKSKKSTVRTIESITIQRNSNEITMDFTGDGFLYHMVRLMSGAIILAGENKLSPNDIRKILASSKKDDTIPLAPAKGLMLMEVSYN